MENDHIRKVVAAMLGLGVPHRADTDPGAHIQKLLDEERLLRSETGAPTLSVTELRERVGRWASKGIAASPRVNRLIDVLAQLDEAKAFMSLPADNGITGADRLRARLAGRPEPKADAPAASGRDKTIAALLALKNPAIGASAMAGMAAVFGPRKGRWKYVLGGGLLGAAGGALHDHYRDTPPV